MSAPDLLYWLGFAHVPGIGAARMRRLLDAFPSVGDAWHAGGPELRAAGLDQRTVTSLQRTRAGFDGVAELAALERLGMLALTWNDARYPRRLKEIDDPPLVLYVRGDLQADDEWAVAVVGTRRPTAYGRQVAEQLAGDLARAGITIISGLAHGIDSCAHRAAIAAGGRTLAVQACGLDTVYPAENLGLARQVMACGALLGEYPPGTKPHPASFPARNRIIAGLSLGAVIVEGDESSGALITARQAVDQNREVFAVPGPILSPASAGPNKLIHDGEARLVRSAADVIEELNLRAALAGPPPRQPTAPARPGNGVEQRLLAALSWEPVHVDEVVRTTGVPVATVNSTLTVLELQGIVRQVGSLHYVRVRA